MQTLRTKAIVLRRTNYGEADRIIQLLTPERKLSVLARGVRKNKSKLAGALEPFSLCDVTIALGRGELGTLTSARLEVFYRGVLQSYSRLQLGSDIVKEVSRLAEHIDEPVCFALLKTALESLHDAKISENIVRMWFALQIAELSGQGYNFATDANGHALDEKQRYDFSMHDRAFHRAEEGIYGANEIKFLRLALTTTPTILERVKIAPAVVQTLFQNFS